MKIHLNTLFGPPLDVELTDRDLPVVLGRGDHADVSIADHWISRVHCVVGLSSRGVYVRDLDSRHGTHVNGQPVRRAELHPGDHLDIGLTTLVVDIAFESSFFQRQSAVCAR